MKSQGVALSLNTLLQVSGDELESGVSLFFLGQGTKDLARAGAHRKESLHKLYQPEVTVPGEVCPWSWEWGTV
jgi:hypothetical protein